MASRRLERAQDLIKEEISRLLLFKVKDPRLRVVSVTRVRMTGDLRRATVMYSIYDDQADRAAIQACLEKATGFMRREVGRILEMKFTPEILFEFDPSLEYAQHLDQLLGQLTGPSSEGGDDSGS